MTPPAKSLRTRLTAFVTVPVVAVAAAVVAMDANGRVHDARSDVVRYTTAIVTAMSQDLQRELLLGEQDVAIDLTSRIESFPEIRRLDLLDQDGTVAFAFRAPGADRSEIPLRDGDGEDVLRVDLPVLVRGQSIGAVRVETLLDGVERETRQVWASAAITLGAIVLLGGILVVMLRRTVTDPLARLERQASALGRGDMETEIRTGRADELGRLAETLDAMRRNLKISYAEVRAQNAELVELNRLKEYTLGAAIFRAFFEHAPDAILTTDDEGRYVDANPAARRLYGRTKEEFLACKIGDFQPEADRASAHVAFDRLRAEGVLDGSARVLRPDGDVREVEYHSRASVLPDRHLAVLRDVTEERKAAEQRAQSHRLEAVGRLAGGIAHDFNNLLTAILGFGRIVQTKLGPAHPQARALSQIVASGERAADLTKQLLAFGRRQVFQVTTLDLRTVVADTAPMLERLVGGDVELKILASPRAATIRADRGQLEHVLMSLAVHARETMPKGGTLTVQTSETEFDGQRASKHADLRPGLYVRLSVSDTGAGMDASTVERLFDPFFTTRELGRGTGLGLASAYGIVRQSEGQMVVSSEPGAGTTFHVYLPHVDAAAVAVPAAGEPVAPVARGDEVVMLVDDEPGLRELGRAVLESLGYRVLVAASGADALEKARGHDGRIDLLVTDVVMPGMSGRELVERLSVDRPETKSLYMSGYDESEVVRNGVRKDGTFVHKPFTADGLARSVRSMIGAPPAAETALP